MNHNLHQQNDTPLGIKYFRIPIKSYEFIYIFNIYFYLQGIPLEMQLSNQKSADVS